LPVFCVAGNAHLDKKDSENSTAFNSPSRLFSTKKHNVYSKIDHKIGDGTIKTQDGAEPVQKVKKILKGISLYFNPGQFVAIMGPSGTYNCTSSVIMYVYDHECVFMYV